MNFCWTGPYLDSFLCHLVQYLQLSLYFQQPHQLEHLQYPFHPLHLRLFFFGKYSRSSSSKSWSRNKMPDKYEGSGGSSFADMISWPGPSCSELGPAVIAAIDE